MKILILFLLLFLSFPARSYWNEEHHQYPIVKVRSGVKGMPPRYAGSGFAFRFQNKIFVLTSDHVIARTNNSFIHTVRGQFLPYTTPSEYIAEYVFADWGRHFAVLALPQLPDQVLNSEYIPNFSELSHSGVIGTFYVGGYPANSVALAANKSYGNVTQTNKYQDFGAQLSSVWEESYIGAEFGMSGGALYALSNEDDHMHLLGILSHQIYNPASGNLEDLTPGNNLGDNTVISVPFDSIKYVIEDYLTHGSSPYLNFYEQVTSGADIEAIDTSKLTFNIYRDEKLKTADEVDIRFNSKRKNQTTLYEDNNNLLQKIELALRTREMSGQLKPSTVNMLQVIGWREKGQYKTWQGFSISSLVEFVRKLDDTNYEPVMYYAYENIDDIRQNIRSFREKFNGCDSFVIENESRELCDRLQWISDALTLPQESFNSFDFGWAVLKPTDFDDLLTNPKYSNAWSKIPYSAGGRTDLQELKKYFVGLTL